eukprot:TRINITY_DN41675_c0_g1_i1.p1 TRINITY_DN41675_c0_g1~~TRINITY_DN41675_c0_g1_i1.p1  ORF type:complete len:930 (-),score=189.14 TRINITY_DN41675_c0_g1_i1:65-2854(-)
MTVAFRPRAGTAGNEVLQVVKGDSLGGSRRSVAVPPRAEHAYCDGDGESRVGDKMVALSAGLPVSLQGTSGGSHAFRAVMEETQRQRDRQELLLRHAAMQVKAMMAQKRSSERAQLGAAVRVGSPQQQQAAAPLRAALAQGRAVSPAQRAPSPSVPLQMRGGSPHVAFSPPPTSPRGQVRGTQLAFTPQAPSRPRLLSPRAGSPATKQWTTAQPAAQPTQLPTAQGSAHSAHRRSTSPETAETRRFGGAPGPSEAAPSMPSPPGGPPEGGPSVSAQSLLLQHSDAACMVDPSARRSSTSMHLQSADFQRLRRSVDGKGWRMQAVIEAHLQNLHQLEATKISSPPCPARSSSPKASLQGGGSTSVEPPDGEMMPAAAERSDKVDKKGLPPSEGMRVAWEPAWASTVALSGSTEAGSVVDFESRDASPSGTRRPRLDSSASSPSLLSSSSSQQPASSSPKAAAESADVFSAAEGEVLETFAAAVPGTTWGDAAAVEAAARRLEKTAAAAPLVSPGRRRLSTGSPGVYGRDRLHRGTISALASECDAVSSRYEHHLKELRLLATAMHRTAGSPPPARATSSRSAGVAVQSPRVMATAPSSSLPMTSPGGGSQAHCAPPPRVRSPGASGSRRPRNSLGASPSASNVNAAPHAIASTAAPPPPSSVYSPRGVLQAAPAQRTERFGSMASSLASPRGSSPRGSPPRGLVAWRPATAAPAQAAPSGMEEKEYIALTASLRERGLLSTMPTSWDGGGPEGGAANDLEHVRALFEAQMPEAAISQVYRIEQSGLAVAYGAVREAMGSISKAMEERVLWHGTSPDRVRNIVLGGFNRAYCGRHGTKLGQGTYFSSKAAYSARFCDRRKTPRTMILARVFVGAWTQGQPGWMEPPFRDEAQLTRFDSTADNLIEPSIFCVFRDFQALPLYLVEFVPREPR